MPLFQLPCYPPCGADYVKGRTGPGTGKRSIVESVGLHLLTRNVPDIDSMNRGRDDGKWIEQRQSGVAVRWRFSWAINKLSDEFNDSGQKIVFQSKKTRC